MSEKITDLYDVLRLHKEGKKIIYRHNSLDEAYSKWEEFKGRLPDKPYEFVYQETREADKIIEEVSDVIIYSRSGHNGDIHNALRTILNLRAQPGCGGGLENGWVGSLSRDDILRVEPISSNEKLFPCFSSKELCQQAIDNVRKGCIIEAIKVLSGRV